MPAPRKYPDELKARATRLAVDARADASTRRGAIARIAGQVDVHPEALRGWVRVAEAGGLPTEPATGTTVSDRERVVDLEAQVRELKRANLILRQAATFFGAELDRHTRLTAAWATSHPPNAKPTTTLNNSPHQP